MHDNQIEASASDAAAMIRLAAVGVDRPHGTDLLLARTADALSLRGVRLAGVVQRNAARANRSRCDMDLAVLPSRRIIRISQDRGEGARGCHLDHGALEEAVAHVEAAIRFARPDLVIVNKFGKREAQGRGFVPVISASLEAGIPVLVGINNVNRAAFDVFAADLAQELLPVDHAVLDWCLAAIGRAAPVAPSRQGLAAPVS